MPLKAFPLDRRGEMKSQLLPGRVAFIDPAARGSGAVYGRDSPLPLPRHGTDHDSKPLPSFPGFCLPACPLQCRQEEHRSGSTTAQRFGRSLLALLFAGTGLRPARRTALEFIPLWGFLVFLLYTMRRINCRRCGIVAAEEVPWGDGKRTLTKAYMLFLARWPWRPWMFSTVSISSRK